jgi:hypothetical protein
MATYKVVKWRKKTIMSNPFQALEMIQTTREEDLPFGLWLQDQWDVDSSWKVCDSSYNHHNFLMKMLIEYHGNIGHEVDQNSNCKRTHNKITIIHIKYSINVQVWMLDHAMEK